ncbi:MAG: hypothetical protein RBT72_06995 [Spirochaetia bacterium]|nr:hypothetical protein [Spirochaetia bacterium]
MRRLLALIFLTSVLAASLAAQDVIPGLSPKDARSMGMGGGFRVFSTGYQSFFGNPAGYADRRSITLADVALWAYVDPSPANLRALSEIAQADMPVADAQVYLGRQVAENDFGAGASLGFGWSGEGLGLGLTMISEALATGDDYGTAKATIRNEASAILGIAFPVELGPFALTLGADVRAFYRLDSTEDWLFSTLADAFLNQTGYNTQISGLDLVGGSGFAVDGGLTLRVGGFSMGLMVRDYGYSLTMGDTSIGGIVESYYLPFAGDTVYTLEPRYYVGMGLSLNQTKWLRSSIYIETDDPAAYVKGVQNGFSSSFDMLHAGMELSFARVLALRAGFNKGLLSLGLGLDLSLIELDAAIFSEQPGDEKIRTGIALQAALRI